MKLAIPINLIEAIKRHLATPYSDDPSKLRALNEVAYLGEQLVELYRARQPLEIERTGNGIVGFMGNDVGHIPLGIPAVELMGRFVIPIFVDAEHFCRIGKVIEVTDQWNGRVHLDSKLVVQWDDSLITYGYDFRQLLVVKR